MGRWDKLIVNQAFDVPTISFFIISYRLMPNPCQFYFDIKFGERLYSKEKMPGTPLLFIFIFAFKKKEKKKNWKGFGKGKKYLEHQKPGRRNVCPSEPAYNILDCRILRLSAEVLSAECCCLGCYVWWSVVFNMPCMFWLWVGKFCLHRSRA